MQQHEPAHAPRCEDPHPVEGEMLPKDGAWSWASWASREEGACLHGGAHGNPCGRGRDVVAGKWRGVGVSRMHRGAVLLLVVLMWFGGVEGATESVDVTAVGDLAGRIAATFKDVACETLRTGIGCPQPGLQVRRRVSHQHLKIQRLLTSKYSVCTGKEAIHTAGDEGKV